MNFFYPRRGIQCAGEDDYQRHLLPVDIACLMKIADWLLGGGGLLFPLLASIFGRKKKRRKVVDVDGADYFIFGSSPCPRGKWGDGSARACHVDACGNFGDKPFNQYSAV